MRRLILIVAGLASFAITTVARADEPFEKGWSLGESVLIPAGLNAEVSYEFGKRAIYLSGMYWGKDLHGIHGGFTLERGGTQRQHFAVNMVGGTAFFRDDDDSVTRLGYGGFEGYFRYRAFFIAPALTFASGKIDDDSGDGVGVLGRLGFIWRLK